VREAVRIGRLLEEHRYGFYEEPCPFDWLWETKEVADALAIPVAGGERDGQRVQGGGGRVGECQEGEQQRQPSSKGHVGSLVGFDCARISARALAGTFRQPILPGGGIRQAI
jgi:hypothetical protein